MCDICQDRGLVIEYDDELGDVKARPCECMKIKAIQNRLKTAGIPEEKVLLKDFSLAYYSTSQVIQHTNKTHYQSAKDALRAAKIFVSNPEDGICLIGPAGRGKTFLARATSHGLVARGHEIIFIVVPDLLAEIKSTYNGESKQSELDILDAARKVKVLFLDDLGAHNYTDWVQTQLYSILNYRMNNKLPTFITTNLSIGQMRENLGERITSRIIDLCQMHYIDCDKDLRTLKRKSKNRQKAG